ncbi:MAG: hypothetical protein MRZ79_19335 [Bacteroidia bacterium]|nr:hypothetical protein [Bacteroidia bacterium]
MILLLADVHAQVSGFRGKRWMLFTDLATPALERGYTIGIGLARSRRHTVTVSFADWGRKTTVASFVRPNVEVPLEYHFQTIEIGLNKFYNKAMPAPRGWYRMLSYRYGKGNFSYTDEISRRDPDTGNSLTGLNTYELTNINRHEINWGYGYFHLFPNRLFVDISLNTNFGWLINGALYEYTSTYDGFIGPNLTILERTVPLDADLSIGLSTKIRLGVLF